GGIHELPRLTDCIGLRLLPEDVFRVLLMAEVPGIEGRSEAEPIPRLPVPEAGPLTAQFLVVEKQPQGARYPRIVERLHLGVRLQPVSATVVRRPQGREPGALLGDVLLRLLAGNLSEVELPGEE